MVENIFVGMMIVCAVAATVFGVWLENGKAGTVQTEKEENPEQEKE